MAAGILPKPGMKLGPCRKPCSHRDCAESRRMAATICRFCGLAVGYNTRFYNADGLCHADCLEDAPVPQEAQR